MISVYFAAGTAIVLSDYWVIRKRMLKVPDLYKGKDGIYWYHNGINWKCIIALFGGAALCLPGFFMTCIDATSDKAWTKMFQICWFIAAPLGFLIYYALNKIWPPVGLGIREFLPEADGSIEVIDSPESLHSSEGKTAIETTKKAEDSVV